MPHHCAQHTGTRQACTGQGGAPTPPLRNTTSGRRKVLQNFTAQSQCAFGNLCPGLQENPLWRWGSKAPEPIHNPRQGKG